MQESLSALIIERSLEVLRRDYEEEEVKVEILSDVSRIFTNEGFIDLSKGSEYTLPRWIARVLEKQGVVKIKDDTVDLEKLSKIAYNEEATLKKPQLVKLQPHFYMLVREEIENIKKRLQEKQDINLLDDLKKYVDLLYTIGRIRLRKIINILLMIEVSQDFLDKMSMEEKLLYRILRDSLMTWVSELGVEKI